MHAYIHTYEHICMQFQFSLLFPGRIVTLSIYLSIYLSIIYLSIYLSVGVQSAVCQVLRRAQAKRLKNYRENDRLK